ncbi:hypothetical protein LTR86_000703 [Recurvomyces mirabilis]|nr:hypothetical protein LTR86_000703 [Recurvomyces mirabilis]
MPSKCNLLAVPRELRALIYDILIPKLLKTTVPPSVRSPSARRLLWVSARPYTTSWAKQDASHTFYTTSGGIKSKVTDLDANHLLTSLSSLTEAERAAIRSTQRIGIEFYFTDCDHIDDSRLAAWQGEVELWAAKFFHLRRVSFPDGPAHNGRSVEVAASRAVWRILQDWGDCIAKKGAKRFDLVKE